MEEFQGTLLEAHQHVFDTFDKFGAVLDDARIGDAIADILSTAGRNRQLYVELMQGFNSSAVGGLAARYIRPGDPWDEPSLLAARLQGGRSDGAEEAWHVVAGPVGDSHLTPTSPRRSRSSYYPSRLLLPRAVLDARRLWHVMPFKSREESIPSVQAPDFGDWHDLPQLRPLDRSPVRRILGEGEVGPGAVVVVPRQNPIR
jgi:hypothetical protein